MSKKLIVNADDYGRSPGVSRGILQAHCEGIVTSTNSTAHRILYLLMQRNRAIRHQPAKTANNTPLEVPCTPLNRFKFDSVTLGTKGHFGNKGFAILARSVNEGWTSEESLAYASG